MAKTSPNPNVKPDIDDPHYYCKSCQLKYKNRNSYRAHLLRMHKMEMPLLIRMPVYDPIISADSAKDPNRTCTICKIKYSTKCVYQRHMKKFHQDGRNTPIKKISCIANPHIQPEPNDPNFYCASCKKDYSTKVRYHDHIRLHHIDVKLSNREFPVIPIMMEMDAGDHTNKRCTICNHEYTTRRSYRKHINLAH